MFINMFHDPPWTIVMEGEEIGQNENMDCWEVGPEEDAPDPLQTVLVQDTSSIWEPLKFEIGIEQTKKLNRDRDSHDKSNGVTCIHDIEHFDS